LLELQQQIFKKGEYGQTRHFSSEILDKNPQLKAAVETLRKLDEQRLKNFGPIRSIDDLREAFGEEGTHTIIDIAGINEKPDFGVAYPAPQEVMQEVYGTARPTHKDIEAKFGHISEALNIERWQAIYLMVFENDIPKEIYFEGCSGD